MLGKLKKFFEPTDMTAGAPWKVIGKFSIPLVIGNIAQQLYSTVDSVIVGKYVGDNALAAVGSASPILMLLYVLFIGISAGVGIMVAQYFGAKSKEDLSETIGNCITITAISCLALAIVSPLIIGPALRMLNTPESIIGWCETYLLISMVGGFGMAYYNILSGVLRGMGDSFSGLIYLLISTVINIVLDIVFVAGLGLEVPGVALATVIAQSISAALCLNKMLKMKEAVEIRKEHFVPKEKYVKQIINLGLPSGVTQAIMSSAMIIVQSLTNSFGEMFIAANVIIMRVDGFAMMPNFSFGMAMTTYAGQNIGAGKVDRVAKGAKQGTIMAVGVSATITALILIFGKYLMGIFTETVELVEMSRYLMGILAVGYIAMAVTQSLSGVMRGAGDTMTPMWISMFTTVLVRVPVAYGISFLTRTPELPVGRFECIHVSLLTSWCLGAIITAIFFARGKWKNKAIRRK